jgi:hypothetical protein
MVHSVWLSILQALKSWRTIAWLVLAAVGVAKQAGLIETAFIPPSWVWWCAAITVLFVNNVAITYELRTRSPERPDIPAVTAFILVWHRSRRAAQLVRRRDELLNIPRPLEHHMTAAGIIEERLKQRLREEFHDAMRQGRITAWGTPSSGGPEKRIDAEEWSNFEIAFDDEELTSIPYPFGGVNQLAAWQRKTDTRSPVRCYANVQFAKRDILAEFPLRLLPRRIDSVPLLKRPQDVVYPDREGL